MNGDESFAKTEAAAVRQWMSWLFFFLLLWSGASGEALAQAGWRFKDYRMDAERELRLQGKAVGLGFDVCVRLVRTSAGDESVEYSLGTSLLMF
ncbi:MAG: hypothetical protein ACM3XZ_02085 [Betaproteobacteria bacterium]